MMTESDLRKNLLLLAAPLVLVGGVLVLAVITAPLLESPQNPAAVSSAEVALLTNKERTQKDIPVLQRNSLLDQAAQMKAQDMAANGYYAHVSPDGVTPMHWVEKAGYKYLIIGENLVVNRTDAGQVVDAFMGSPGHRANILRSDFTEIGIGVANGIYKGKDATFTVQIFAAPYPQAVPKKEVPKAVVKPVPVPATTPVPTKPAAVVSVPRSTSATATTTKMATTSRPSDALQKEVTRLISPILSSIQNASTSTSTATTTTQLERPSFSLNTSVPIELAGVSRLEADTLPVPIGSSWTMEVRLFIDSVFAQAKSFFR